MKLIRNGLCCFTILAGFFCSGAMAAEGHRDATVQASADMIAAHKGDASFVILDVRTKEEFDAGHLEGAVNLDVMAPGFKEEAAKLDKGKTYLIHCRSGKRSKNAQGIFQEMGFTDTINMLGGYVDWEKAGHPTVK